MKMLKLLDPIGNECRRKHKLKRRIYRNKVGYVLTELDRVYFLESTSMVMINLVPTARWHAGP